MITIRHFSYYLFENFDADAQGGHPLNPRRVLNTKADAILSFISGFPAGCCRFEDCANIFDRDMLNALVAAGAVRREEDCILFDTPVFLREDAAVLQERIPPIASMLTDDLEKCIPQIRSLCAGLHNGFPVEQNLYHILCGMVFDGAFFDYLERSNAVATSRMHISGLDYLSVIYEQCPELDASSDGLLCSYNRFANSSCALQSFGDANGSRHDFYRFFRLWDAGNLPGQYRTAQLLWEQCGFSKDKFLHHVSAYIRHGSCPDSVLALLEHFGYAENGMLSVPVYTAQDRAILNSITAVVELQLGSCFAAKLTELSGELDITASRHRVPLRETANELYHLLFGTINEELVRREIVAAPPYYPGEGRYRKCIQLQ